jgi:hypothetical protein
MESVFVPDYIGYRVADFASAIGFAEVGTRHGLNDPPRPYAYPAAISLRVYSERDSLST